MNAFINDNWIIFLVTILIMVTGALLEKKNQIISKSLKLEMSRFYILLGVLGISISIANFIALEFFGTWRLMIYVGIVLFILVFAMIKYIEHRKNKI
ncbi:MAG TPA: hypothetical protein VKY25_03710 [Erysipelothrix sp.]|nr:hypothetical protein [Erysipelothrix sp.]